MYNLHTHTLLSDGVLLPSEVAQRYAALGYKAIAITDHADYSNIDSVIKGVREFTRHWPKNAQIKVLSGIELTHLPLGQFKPLSRYARKNGIQVIIAHGETPVEPVLAGTNQAALEAEIDILAHPGLISDADVLLSKKKDIFLEVTTRKGHAQTNPHVVERAIKLGAKLILNNDSHAPEDIITPEQLKALALKAGLSAKELAKIYQDTESFIKRRQAR